MVDLINKAAELTGAGTPSAFPIGMVLIIFISIILAAIIIGVSFFVGYIFLKYNLKLKIFERINGRFVPCSVLRARIYPLGNTGDNVILTLKSKKVLPMPSLQTGKRTYWYFISDDGEWINFDLSDFDQDRREANAHFLDKEMRYARASLAYVQKERFDKPGFWEKYGGLIAYVSLIVVTGLMMFLIVKEMVDLAGASQAAIEASKEVLVETKKIVGALDNLKGSGGIR